MFPFLVFWDAIAPSSVGRLQRCTNASVFKREAFLAAAVAER
jgi:hypothetical protein